MPPTLNTTDPKNPFDEDTISGPELIGVLVVYFSGGIAVVHWVLVGLQRAGVL